MGRHSRDVHRSIDPHPLDTVEKAQCADNIGDAPFPGTPHLNFHKHLPPLDILVELGVHVIYAAGGEGRVDPGDEIVFIGAPDLDRQVYVPAQSFLDLLQQQQTYQRHHGYADGEIEKSDAAGDAERGCDPEAGGGGESADRRPFPDDRSGAQETDAGHHLCGDAPRIDSNRPDAGKIAEDAIELDGADAEKAGAEGDQKVGPEACRPAVDLSLQADNTAQKRRQEQPQ